MPNNLVRISEEILQNTADAIREKLNSEETIKPVNFPQKISDIKMGKIYNVNITQSANQTIKVSEVTTYTNSQNSFTINTATYVPRIKASLTANTGYNKGTLNVSENTTITLSEGTTNISATPATIKQFTVTVTQTENQTITVTCNGVDYTSSFTANYGDTWTASIVATNTDYNPGILSAGSGTITSNISISATPATAKRQIIINQVPGSIISVTINNATYTSSFFVDSLLQYDGDNTYMTITQTANSMYSLGQLDINGLLPEYYDTSSSQTTYVNSYKLGSGFQNTFSTRLYMEKQNGYIIIHVYGRDTDNNEYERIISLENGDMIITQASNIYLPDASMTLEVSGLSQTNQTTSVYINDQSITSNTTFSYQDLINNDTSIDKIEYTVASGYLAGDIYIAKILRSGEYEYINHGTDLSNPNINFNLDNYIDGIIGYRIEVKNAVTGGQYIGTLTPIISHYNTSDGYSFTSYRTYSNKFTYNSREYVIQDIHPIYSLQENTPSVADIASNYVNNNSSDNVYYHINGNKPALFPPDQRSYTTICMSDLDINAINYDDINLNNFKICKDNRETNGDIAMLRTYISMNNSTNDNKVFYIKFPRFGSTIRMHSIWGYGPVVYNIQPSHMLPFDPAVTYSGLGSNAVETIEVWRL